MQVAVVGAGAMGSIFGAAFTEAGEDTTLVDVSAPLVELVARDGLTIVDGDGERHAAVAATTTPGDLGPQDIVLFCVKNYHTASAIELAQPLIGAETTVVSLQNGWGNGEVIADAVGDQRLVVGVTYGSGTVREPGRVAYTGRGTTFVGPYGADAGPHAERVATLLRDSGFDVEAPESIRVEIWKKLVLNAATLPTAALTLLTAGALGTHEAMLPVVDAVAREAVAVARAVGHPLEEDERLDRIHRILAGGGDGKASMLQDVEAGRRTEIDVITGAVVREAEAHGVDVPVNRALLGLVHGMEQGRGLR